LAVKIIRQPKKIVLLGSATSAAGLRGGHERAPAALRAAGLADRLRAAGFEVADHGDTATQVFKADDEHPRARNVPAILKSLNDLRPRVEVAVKTGGLPLIVSGDCISVLATVAGTRRYYRNVSLMYMDRDADLNLPATTPSGFIDGMVISHVIGRGAPELVRAPGSIGREISSVVSAAPAFGSGGLDGGGHCRGAHSTRTRACREARVRSSF
jgi:arginase